MHTYIPINQSTRFFSNLRSGILVFCFLCLNLYATNSTAQTHLRVIVAGLNHNHVNGILSRFKEGKVDIIGIAEPNKALWIKFGILFKLPDSLFGTDLEAMLIKKKPDAVLGYNETGGHLSIVRLCAPLGIPVMVEKPLAANLQQAREIETLAGKYNIKVLTNYETTWYASYADIFKTIGNDSIGQIRRMVVHDGHQGPKEIGCSPEFLSWLTDPVLNGGGALTDFGCYGADLMTWFMKGIKPIAVTAITRHYKPMVYPKVDDDATVILEYPGATGQIEASWNWPFGIKDLEIFGEKGYLHGLDGSSVMSRSHETVKTVKIISPLEAPYNDPVIYLSAVIHHQLAGTDDLSSLKYNMIVMQILDAAKRSAAQGKRIIL